MAVLLVFTGLPISAVAKKPSNAIDIGVDCLMSVFDLSKSQELVRINTKSIIDSEKVKDSNLMYGMTSGPLTYAEYYAGEDVMSYAKEAGQDISAGISEEISAGMLFKINLSGKISESVKTDYAKSTESYFNTFKVIHKVGVNKVQLDVPADYDEVRSILKDQFKTALLAADTESEINALYDLYGTHFIAAYSLGGWAEATTSTVNTSSSIKNELKDAFSSEAGAKASAGEYGAGLSIAFSLQNTISSTYNTSEYKTATYNKVYGGKGGLVFSDASQANTVYNNWVNTINPYDSTTTEIVVDNNLELVGIWDLLPAENTAQIAKMKQVFIDRLGQFNESFVNTFVYSNYAIDGVKKLSVDLLEDESGIDTEPNVPAGYIPISTVAQFKAIGTGSYPLNGKYILLNDLDFGNTSISPIGGTSGTSFTGIFDGNGFTLKNISSKVSGLTAVTYYYGLIGNNAGIIKNIILDNVKYNISTQNEAPIRFGEYSIGLICGNNSGTIEKCVVQNAEAKLETIAKNGKENTLKTALGGIAGTNNGNISFSAVLNSNLYLYNTLWTADNYSVNRAALGGFVGIVTDGSIQDCYTNNCYEYVYMHSGHMIIYITHKPDMYLYLGGFIGKISGTTARIKRCFSFNSICGWAAAASHGAGHNNSSHVHVYAYFGEFISHFDDGETSICSNCYYNSNNGNYGTYFNDGTNSTIATPAGIMFSASLIAMKNIFISNGWKMDENDIYPTFDVSQKSFSFVVACPNLFENVYPGDVLPDELKIYFVTSYPAYSVYEDITDNALIAYDFSEDKSGSIQVAYLKENTVYLGTVEIELSEIKLESVEVESLPAETEFQIGNAFSADGLVLKANYNNGSYAYVSDDLVTSFDNKVIESSGEKTVTVIYNTKETNYNISCYECKGTNTHTESAAVNENVVNATCTSGGSFEKAVYCSVCGKELRRDRLTTAALNHKWGAWTQTDAPLCLVDGEEQRVCLNDTSHIEKRKVAAIGHNYVGAVTKEPSCTEKGVMTYTCKNDASHYFTEDIDELDHTPDAEVMKDKIEATCTVDGSYNMVVYCATCGEELSATPYTIPAPGHTPGADATCTDDQTCTACGEVLTEKLGHDEIPHEAKAPTCTEIGWDAYVTCSRCDYTTYVEKSALGHAEENHDEQPATCTETGYTAGVYCTRCKTWLSGHEEIPIIDHDYKAVVTDPTCTEDGCTTYTCSVCGDTYTADETSATGHDWGEWTVRTPATAETEGEEVRTCGRCDKEEIRTIDKLPLPTELIIYKPYTIAKETADRFAVVSINTTVADILAASNGTDVLTATGEKAAATEKLATGMVLAIMDGETVVDSMEIAVLGDVNGDGAHTSVDARSALRASVGLDTVTAAQLTAAKVNGGTALVANDARDILRASVGLDEPKSWFEKF